jgi:ubiquinone/menaquinone biosynthesis C-methylase UbiE
LLRESSRKMLKNILVSLFFFASFFCGADNVHANGKDEFRFVVLGCAHLGVCGYEEFEATIDRIKEYKPDFVLFLGGMVDPAAEEPVESLWNKFDQAVVRLGVPVYNVTDDCRLTGLSVSPAKMDLMKKCFLGRYKGANYSFEYKNNLFLALDSPGVNSGQGESSDARFDFVKRSVEDASPHDNIFIFMNDSPWLEPDSTWLKKIHPLIEKKVKFVFGARKHYLSGKKIGDVMYLTTGTPACYAKASHEKLAFPNFILVEAEKGDVRMRVVPVKPIPVENMGILSSLGEKNEPALREIVKPYRLVSEERRIFLRPERVIENMQIKPGMEILDLGSGSGFFAFRFADALKNTGMVFAADMDPQMINYMRDRIKAAGYRNVAPVLVDAQGVDRFYKQHVFDIIFFCEGYQYLRNPEGYFRELRQSLKKNGRLYVIQAKNVYDFTEIEIGDFSRLCGVLASKGEDYPVFRKFDSGTINFIRSWRGEEISASMRVKIVDNLNRMLLDRRFFYDLMDYYAVKGITEGEGEWSAPLTLILFNGERDVRLVKWLFVNLDANGVFDAKEKPLTHSEEEQLRKMNKILLCSILGTHKIEDLQGEFCYPIYVKKESIVSTLKKSGYQFVREYDFLPLNDFLEFQK